MPLSIYKNQYVSRPDLAEYGKREFKTPVGMIGGKVMPRQFVPQLSGVFYFRPWETVPSAQTGRSPSGSVTFAGNTSTAKSFTAKEVISRMGVDISQIPLEGGDENAEMRILRNAFLAAQGQLETDIVSALAFSDPDAVITGAVYAGIKTYKSALLPKVRGHRGKMCLVGGTTALETVRNDTIIAARFLNIGIAPDSRLGNADAREIGLSGIASTLGISEVIEGSDSYWPSHSVLLGWLPEVGEDDEATEDATASAQLGRTLVYKYADPVSGWISVREGFAYDLVSPFIDAVSYYTPTVLNGAFFYRLQVTAGNPITTTTTTATTSATATVTATST